MTRKSGSGFSWEKYLIVSGALVLLAAGFYAGFRAAQPPPPPDFESLRQPTVGDGSPAVGDGSPGGGSLAGGSPGVEDPSSVYDDGPDLLSGDFAADPDPGAEEAPAIGPSPLEIVRQPPPVDGKGRRIALVIDDLGRSLKDLDTLQGLGVPISYAVLPFEVKTAQVVSVLRRRGAEVLCHLPMEAKGGNNPGPGALFVSMSPEEIRSATRNALDAVPGAVGLNNHMGSAVVTEESAMRPMLEVLAQRDLFFLDSRTTAETVGYSLARQTGVPSAERQVFLDTHRNREFIRGQFQQLLRSAEGRGAAIAIAHPYRETLEVLQSEVPKAREAGFEFVTVGRLMDR